MYGPAVDHMFSTDEESSATDVMVSLWARALPVALLLTTGACSLDFDKFETADGAVDDHDGVSTDGPIPDGRADTPGGDRDAGDAGPGDTTQSDGSSGQLLIGASCKGDGECPGGVCVDSYCTRSCQTDAQCPDGAECRPLDGESRCLLTCPPDGSCPDIGGRTDLICSVTRRRPRPGRLAALDESCLPDSDGDEIHDTADNCPQQKNPVQRDRDGDGEGDVCDDNPKCHSGASSGWLDLGPVTYRGDDFTGSEILESGRTAIVGGVGSSGDPVDDTAWVQTHDETWSKGQALPYPASNHGVAPLPGSSAFLTTPGEKSTSQIQLGRLLALRSDQAPDEASAFPSSALEPTLGTTRYGALAMVGFTDEGSDFSRVTWIYRPDDESFESKSSSSGIGNIEKWSVVRRIDGGLVFYQRPQTGASSTFTGKTISVSPLGDDVSTGSFSYPTVQSGNNAPAAFDPLLVPGLGGGRYYAFDRNTGKAAIIDLDDDSVTEEKQLDISFPFQSVEHAAVDVRGPAIAIFGRPMNNSDNLNAAVIYPKCAPGFALDSDSDGKADLADNCPRTKNSNQSDIDRDLIGDACDDDTDGDGIPDANDERTDQGGGVNPASDSDNDGVPNSADNDKDNDDIPDSRDRYPLDTDNDRRPNIIDSDSDDDGYDDEAERQAGSNFVDPIDFPGAGVFSFARVTSGQQSQRRAAVAPLGAFDEADVLLKNTLNPHNPRLYGPNAMLALEDAPDQTVKLLRTSPALQSVDSTGNFFSGSLRAAAPIEVDDTGELVRAAVVRRNRNGPGWLLVELTFGMSLSSKTVSSDFQNIWSPDYRDGTYRFAGQFGNCSACGTLFALPDDGSSPSPLDSPPNRPKFVRAGPNGYVTASADPDGGPDRLFVHRGNSLEELPSPPGHTINSAVPLDKDGHVLASVEGGGGSYDVWLYNGLKERWNQVTSTSDDIIEIDWNEKP